MATNPENRRYTLEQYLMMLQNSERRMEYDHGEIFVMVGSSANHVRISQNMCKALDQALGNDATCVAYMVDRVVAVAEEIRFMPDVVVSCDIADHGETFILESPCVVVEVLSKSTGTRDRTYKLVRYQANEHIQAIIFINQFVQQIEVISRIENGWDYRAYDHNGHFTLACIDVTISVADIYRRLQIPILAEQPEPELASNFLPENGK